MFAFDPADKHFVPSVHPSSYGLGSHPAKAKHDESQDGVLDEIAQSLNEVSFLGLDRYTSASLVPKTESRNGLDSKSIIDCGEDNDSTETRNTVNALLEISRNGTGTPPVDIAITPAAARSRSRSTHVEDKDPLLDEPTPKIHHLTGRAMRKKKRTQNKAAAPALNTVRGFTPATSGDDDSDFSTESTFKRRDLGFHSISSVTSSPGLRPSSSSGGISALRQQFNALDFEPISSIPSLIKNKSKLGSETPSSASIDSENPSDEEIGDMTSYEVALEHDFVSPDVSQKEAADVENIILDVVTRKMTATDFEPLCCLGKGTYGTVLLVKQVATGRLYAQKQFRKASLTVRKSLVEQTKTERTILESINRHPFVVKLYYAFQDQEKLYLILEYAQGGELFSRMLTERMFPEDTAAFYMAEMVLALEHLHHTVGVVYRDLKPENCLLDSEGHLLLTDFGLSKVAVDGEHRCKSIAGTLEYMAPEVLQNQHYGTAVDWWSFGILGFDLLTGSSPFRANNQSKTKEKILKQKLNLPYFLSADAKDLLTRLLRKEPSKRLGACMPRDMQAIKKHRFFRKIDWKKLELRELEPPIKPLVTDPALAENFSLEFTELAVSPVRTFSSGFAWGEEGDRDKDPFGGFSFVASRSLLESGNGFF
ncbi:serine/threonine protein kinase psk1 [Toensbergia leucococca]|nr:serine/threonine protein kinase psk1 [Toensbergia leucococca]